MALQDPTILADGTLLAKPDTKANAPWNRWYHTISSWLQAIAGYLSGAATAALAGPVTGSVQTPAGVALEVKYAKVSSGAATDAAFVALVALKKIRVLSLAYSGSAADATIVFNSKPAGAGTAVSILFSNKLETLGVLPYSEQGWFETAAGEGLSVTVAGGTVAAMIAYVEV